MKSSILRCALFLLSFAVTVSSVSAQDRVSTSLNTCSAAAWNLIVTNGNQGQQPINRFSIKIATPGVSINDQGGPNAWNANLIGNDSVFYSAAGGSSILAGQTNSSFFLCTDDSNYDSLMVINWYTYSGNTKVGSGTVTVTPTSFALLTPRDSARATGGGGNPDPIFNFSVYNRNGLGFGLTSTSFELLNKNGGIMRPSDIKAPAGWMIDSVTTWAAYFHPLGGNEISSGKSQSGFTVGLIANPNVTNYSFVWRVYNNGTLIDRDTIRNISATPGASTYASSDTLRPVNTTSCNFALTLFNFHASNAALPSPITKVVLTSTTAGITIPSVSTAPINWGHAINGSSNIATFQAASSSDAIFSGTANNQFSLNVNNPSGGNFNLHWETFTGSGTSFTSVSSGDLPLTCTQGVVRGDTALVIGDPTNCCYAIQVTNQHNPSSNVWHTAFSIPAGSGTFQGAGTSTLSWNAGITDKQTITFAGDATNFMSAGTSQKFNICITPAHNGVAVPVTWTTADQQGQQISTGTLSLTCSIITVGKDTVYALKTSDANRCLYNIIIGNRRGMGTPITSVTVTPLNGWQVDSGMAATGWNTTVDPNHTFAQFISTGGFADGTTQGFQVGFFAHNAPQAYQIQVRTSDGTTAQFDTLSLNCSATDGVAPDNMIEAIGLSVSPNPLRSTSEISYNMPYRDRVVVTVIDVLGRIQQTVSDGVVDSGSHSLRFDGSTLSPGTYYVRLETPAARITRKIVIQH